MGAMTATKPHPGRRSLGVRGIAYEGMDRESLLIEAIHLFEDVERVLDIHWEPDDATCRRVGWWLVSRTGTAFRIGHQLLRLTAPDGYLLPPPEFRVSRKTEPTHEQMFDAPVIHPWGIQLWQSGGVPAYWRVTGTVYHRDWSEPRIAARLLYLHRDKRMALTEMGWVKLGRRMHS